MIRWNRVKPPAGSVTKLHIMRAPFLLATCYTAVLAAGLVAAATPRSAHAAPRKCAIAVDGDSTASQVRQELLAFAGPGNEPCIPLQVTCALQEQQVVVTFTDDLGRYVERRFDSPAGAAAFLISWSRRPIAEEHRRPDAPSAARWQPAAGYALLWGSGMRQGGDMLSFSITRHDTGRQPHRYFGVGLRYQREIEGGDLSLIYGVARNSRRALQRLEFRAGLGAAEYPTADAYVSKELTGFSTGLRGALGIELVEDINLELSAGVDLLISSQSSPSSSLPETLGYLHPLFFHLGTQLRWGAIR